MSASSGSRSRSEPTRIGQGSEVTRASFSTHVHDLNGFPLIGGPEDERPTTDPCESLPCQGGLRPRRPSAMAPALLRESAGTSDTEPMVTTSRVDIATGHGLMPADTAVPTTAPPWPGVVVIHDFTGMSQDLRGHANWLAEEGFLAIAPNLYYWGSRLRCLRTIMRDLGPRRGRTFDDIDAARQWLRDHDGCTPYGACAAWTWSGSFPTPPSTVGTAAPRGETQTFSRPETQVVQLWCSC